MDNKHIGYAVKSLHRRINQVIGRIPAIKENKNLTSVQIWILNFLFRNEGRDVFQKDIEAEFNTRRSTATELLKQMEKTAPQSPQTFPEHTTTFQRLCSPMKYVPSFAE